jgi:RNA polymerase sigma-70 factor (ECF subfamily)
LSYSKDIRKKFTKSDGKNMKNFADEKLIDNYLKGDEQSLEVLIRRYLKPIYSFCFRFVGNSQEAEDITQEIFLKVWRNLKKFKKEKNFKGWLFTIAKNTCFDFLRKKKKISTLSLEKYFYLVDFNPLPNEISEKESLKEKIQEAIEKLSSKTREILNLYYNQGLTFREIAQTLNEPINTVKSRHRRAIEILRNRLKPEK